MKAHLAGGNVQQRTIELVPSNSSGAPQEGQVRVVGRFTGMGSPGWEGDANQDYYPPFMRMKASQP